MARHPILRNRFVQLLLLASLFIATTFIMFNLNSAQQTMMMTSSNGNGVATGADGRLSVNRELLKLVGELERVNNETNVLYDNLLENIESEKARAEREEKLKLENAKPKRENFDTEIHLAGSFPLNQSTEGCTFLPDRVGECFKTDLTASLLKMLSPRLENLAIRHFLGVPGDNPMFANSPAFYLDDDGNFTLVARMWQEAEAYAWLKKRKYPLNFYQDNLFFTVKLNKKLDPIGRGHFLGIPSAISSHVGGGPIEPRIFPFKERLLVSYNTGYRPGPNSFLDYTFIWDYRRQYIMTPQVRAGGSVFLTMKTGKGKPQRRDKHWMALADGDNLYMIQTIEPLRVLKCDLGEEMNCDYVGKRIELAGTAIGSVRGGTPFVVYKWPFYISVVHSTITRKIEPNQFKRYYTFHILVMSVSPAFKVEYMSEQINLDKKVLKICPIVRDKYIIDEFFFPVSIHLETRDSIIVGGHLNDHSAAIIRLVGIHQLMKDVMRLAPIGQQTEKVVQHPKDALNDFAVRSSVRATGYTLYKSNY